MPVGCKIITYFMESHKKNPMAFPGHWPLPYSHPILNNSFLLIYLRLWAMWYRH